jgi:hypothetical protein
MVHGVSVRAMAVGTRAALATPVWDEGTQTAAVVLTLLRAPPVNGRVVSSEGKPLAGAQVLVIVRKDEHESSHDFARTAAAAAGWVVSITFSDGAVVSTLHVRARTDDEGRFSFSVPVSGNALVITYPKGHRPTDFRFNSDVEDEIELIATPVASTSAVIEYRGVPLTGGFIVAADLSYPVEQPNFGWLTIDASGRIDTTWMVEGRLYAIVVKSSKVPPSKRGVLRWAGQSRLELDELTMDGFELTRERATIVRSR